jgi:hypothetical protein
MTPRVEWKPDVPAEVRAAVEPLLPDAVRFAPGWLADLTLAWDDGDGESCAKMTTAPEYRMATLAISASFLSQPARARAEILRHEVLHAVAQPVIDVLANIADAAALDEKTRDWAITVIGKAREGLVCDLEIMLRGVCPIADPAPASAKPSLARSR